MTGKTHDLAAITALGFAAYSLPPGKLTIPTVIVSIFANQLGGIFPDIDQPTAPLWRNLPIGGFFGRIVGKSLGGHRGLSHSLLGICLFGFLAKSLLTFLTPVMHRVDTGYVWWAFIIGFASHICMDLITKEGVPLLLPINHKFGFPPIKQLRIVTGKKAEFLIILPALVVLNIWFYSSHYAVLVRIITSFQE